MRGALAHFEKLRWDGTGYEVALSRPDFQPTVTDVASQSRSDQYTRASLPSKVFLMPITSFLPMSWEAQRLLPVPDIGKEHSLAASGGDSGNPAQTNSDSPPRSQSTSPARSPH
jgi:hypothetical protein